MASTLDGAAGGKKRKRAAPGLADLHDDMLERVLARLPPASYFRLRAVSRRWRAAAESRTFRAACERVTARDPWFLMLADSDHQDQDRDQRPAAVFDSAERAWARWRAAPGPLQPVAAAGGLVLYRDPGTGGLTAVNPLTGASRALPPPPAPARAAGALQAVAMYGSPYRVVLVLGELPDLSTVAYDSSTDAWGEEAALSRKAEPEEEGASSREERAAEADGDGDDDTVYFLSKCGDVVASTMQRSASRQYASAVACRGGGGGGEDAVVYFLSRSGTVVACDLARRAFAELPRILPAYHGYSIDVVACGDGAAYAVVLSEFLDAASLRVWEFAGGTWRQVAAMPPAMAHAFRDAKADVNCVGHGCRVMVCVSSGSGSAGASGCFMCDVRTNRWEELPRRAVEDAATGFVAALSFEPRMEAAV